MNSRKEIISRNRKYLEGQLNMTENEWLEFLKNVGKPLNGFGNDWTPENPSCAWCAGVTSALRLSGKIPDGYVPCRNKEKDGRHYYMINPNTNEVIDLTIYQIDGEYEYDYSIYSRQFGNVLSKNTKKMLDALRFEIDTTKFTIYRKNNYDYIRRAK